MNIGAVTAPDERCTQSKAGAAPIEPAHLSIRHGRVHRRCDPAQRDEFPGVRAKRDCLRRPRNPSCATNAGAARGAVEARAPRPNVSAAEQRELLRLPLAERRSVAIGGVLSWSARRSAALPSCGSAPRLSALFAQGY